MPNNGNPLFFLMMVLHYKLKIGKVGAMERVFKTNLDCSGNVASRSEAALERKARV